MQTQSENQIEICEVFADISETALEPGELLQRARNPRCGGLVLFSGDVREFNQGQTVAFLEYEAHTALAIRTIREILNAAAERWSLGAAACVHRVGRLEPGESAVLVVSAAPHRAAAYQANQYMIQRVKHEAPIWKKEVYADGTHRWGHNCDH